MAASRFNDIPGLLFLATILPSLTHSLHSQGHHVLAQDGC